MSNQDQIRTLPLRQVSWYTRQVRLCVILQLQNFTVTILSARFVDFLDGMEIKGYKADGSHVPVWKNVQLMYISVCLDPN